MSQEQEGQELVCGGAPCRCDKGTVPSMLQVTSNQSVWLQGKLVATTLDTTFVPFGTCALKNNQPCVPALLRWEEAFELVTVLTDGCHPLLEKSTIRCAVGGVVSILNTLQIAVPAPPPVAQAEASRTALLGLAPLLLLPDPAKTESTTRNDDHA
ncbi:PAAR-like protein [Hymenobacter terrenus]|uniref:PAAR-like protein n=1 Tax=Hymenobacter terrenus TaxID=1629124 RepID=UPI0006199E1C|nr:PAAR-like protein [Hymenobacter terrenus]